MHPMKIQTVQLPSLFSIGQVETCWSTYTSSQTINLLRNLFAFSTILAILRTDYVLHFKYDSDKNEFIYKNKITINSKRIVQFGRLTDSNYYFVFDDDSNDFISFKKLSSDDKVNCFAIGDALKHCFL